MPVPQDANKMYDASGNFLKAVDLEGCEHTLTIADSNLRSFKDGNKQVALKFNDTEKELGLNKTNFRTIEAVYGPDPNTWNGKPLILYPTTTLMDGGNTVPCVRVRVPLPSGNGLGKPAQAAKPAPAQPRSFTAAEATPAESRTLISEVINPPAGSVRYGIRCSDGRIYGTNAATAELARGYAQAGQSVSIAYTSKQVGDKTIYNLTSLTAAQGDGQEVDEDGVPIPF